LIKYVFLSEQFYTDYMQCPEIEKKPLRPYIKVLIEIDNNTYAIPLRSNIPHNHVLWTDKPNKCGLDFSKTVIVNNPAYIDTDKKPYIRPNEFDSLRGKENHIKQKLIKYIKTYKIAKQRLDIPRNQLLVKYSALQYFEEFLE